MKMIDSVLGTKSLTEKRLERDRYIEAQINLLQSKLTRLERIFSVGMPLGEAEETIERLDQIEKGIKVNSSKIGMFSSVLKEIKTGQDKIVTGIDDKASIKQVAMLSQRVKFLENIYGELSGSKTKDVFMNIVEILKNVENRVDSLEELAHKNAGLLFEKELSSVQKQAMAEMGGPEQAAFESTEMQGQAGRTQVQKKSTGEKIKGFFRKIFGRE